MKKRIGLGVVAFVMLIVWQLRAAPVNFAWDYDFSVDPACSATVLTNCVKEFHIKEGAVVLQVVAAPTLTGTVNFGPPYGNRTIFVTAVSDTGIESDPSNSVSVNVKPGKPQNVRIP